MKILAPPLRQMVGAAILILLPAMAEASCYATYKAKQDDPLRLHFGVAEMSDKNCSQGDAKKDLKSRLRKEGWILLKIEEMIGEDELGKVRASAGEYFLRY